MDEMKQKHPVYSTASTETTSIGNPPLATRPAGSSETQQTQQFSKSTQAAQIAAFLEVARNRGYSSFLEFTAFLRRTRHAWLIVAGAIFGLIAMVTLVEHVWEWARNARERRQEHAVATVTPDTLIARCCQPAEDLTKEVYPILMRTMSYPPRGNKKLLVAFSRTAEENSDWVFLSMKDESGARSYDTPEAKIAALPCLDSKN